MASKNNPKEREGKVKRKFHGECGHEVVAVLIGGIRGSALMGWHCETCGKRVEKIK